MNPPEIRITRLVLTWNTLKDTTQLIIVSGNSLLCHSLSAISIRVINSLILDTQKQVSTVRIGKENNFVKKVLALIYTYLHNF